MKTLDNQVAIITGAGSGMGRAMAILFAREGARVVASDINSDRLQALESEITSSGGEVTTVVANVGESADITKMLDTALDTYGTLDILVNNAGIMDNFSPVGELDMNVYDRVMRINALGPVMAMQQVISRVFLEKKSGTIINIASLGGVSGAKAGAAYTMSKHALVGLTKNTAYVYAKHGIRCNAIAPGAVNTNIGDSIDMSKVSELAQSTILAGMSVNPRGGEPQDIAEVALFLASDASRFVSGAIVSADGGWGAY